MAEVLKEWLTQRLQRPIKWEAEEFGEKMKNGYIIASILLSYHVINDEKHYYIRASDNIDDIKNNWKLLKEWLGFIDINVTETDLNHIMEGRGSTLLRLFYQLFLHLDKKDRTDFIKRERKMVSTLIEKIDHRFKVEKVPEEKEVFIDDLSRPLLNEKLFIEWQRKKAQHVKDTYDFVKHRYSKMLANIKERGTSPVKTSVLAAKISEKDKRDMEQFCQKYPCKFQNYTYQELLELDKNYEERKKSLIDSEWAHNYMDNLYTKMHKKTDSEEFQKQLRNVISGSLWDLSVAEEESKLDMEFAKKVMKISQFEKQMGTQIMETRQQARNLVRNRIAGESQFIEQRTHQFNQFLDNVKEEINMGLVEIDFEKQRQNMLHKRLHAEKMKRKRQHYYEICYETALSIVDYAARFAYFKRLLENDIPEHFIHEWKALYYKQQPIFDILDPMEDMLKENSAEDEVIPEEEEIVRLELDRQEVLNESEFMEYHNYLYPWTLETLIPNFEPESEERKYEYLGTRVLGHLVYTLLEIKYPYPPQRPPANLTNFTSKAILRCLPDRSMTIPMQTLLNARKIHVVRLEAAINFCLRKFKTEMVGCTDIELSFDKFMAVALEEESKEVIKLLKAEDEIVSKSSEANMSLISGPVPANVKQTQTPKTIPEEEITLSTAADLGQYAYKSLCTGDSLTDYLLAAMIVEYIKDQEDIKGIVIINYPNSYREAQILEEAFSGKAPPDEGELDDRDDIYLEESIIKHRKVEKDPFKEIRVSKLVNDPHKKRIEKPFESYFTCYLKLKETEDILQEVVIWDLTEDNSDFIDRFYAALGINYSMYYEVIEKEQLGLICKHVIGDYSLPLKSSDNLFGENVISLLDFPSSDDKRTKSRIVKSEIMNGKSKDKMRRSSKISRMSLVSEFQVVKAPDSKEELKDENISLENIHEASESSISKSSVRTEEIKVAAGEEDWDYGEIPIAELIGVALATCWEEVEKTYIHDMQQLFLAIRLQMNCLIPYTRFVKDKMEQIITLPSRKQDLVSSFQKEYNDFENDWRDVNLTKNEWHCRVKELQVKLYQICDERKMFAEKQRQCLICENWTLEELTTMVNTYISCMQTELNRSILTFQAFHDFYFAMLKRLPPNDRLSSKDLTKIYRESDETSGSKKGGEDKLFRQLKNAFQDLQLKNIEIDYSNNPFNMIIENNVKFAIKVIKDTNDSYRSIISREYSEIAKIVSVAKKKEENTSKESINEEEIFKQNALKCIEEWTVAINGEMFRASLRILALQYNCFRHMKLFNDNIYRAFTDIQNNINNYYLNEIQSVDRLCKYLQMAVEGGKRIPESLILEFDKFIIDPNLLQFKPEEIIDTVKNPADIGGTQFRVGQVSRLRSQLQIIAPNGIAIQQAFIYILQDFIIFGKENCEGPMFPDAWRNIDPEQVPKLIYLLFGETTYVDWRDFLIYCLNIRFPNVEELLNVRKKFRCKDLEGTELITREDFIKEKLWFETELDPEDKHLLLRNNLVKHFLFELFETAQDLMNYSAFLLAFCKSVNPIEGFAMALSMSLGKKICYSLEECEEVIYKLIRDKKYRDECLACALKCSAQFLDKVIANVVNTCEGTTVIELEYTEPPPEDKKGKGKGGKSGGTKAKKIESTQSARLTKIQKSLSSRSKIAQSATDVKTTFICRPCEEEAEIVEEKVQEKEEVQEEEKIEPQPDPHLVYAVSQDVIWNVLKICLPWHFYLLPEEKVTPYVAQVNEIIARLEVDTDNKDIYVAKFVSEPNVCKILHKANKFTAINLGEEIKKVIM